MPYSHAQSTTAHLIKNVNIRAKGLHHELNKTKDTLILKSDRTINYVYSINRDYEKEVFDYIDDTTFEVPLHILSEGKHTFVVGQSPLKIVFAVYISREKDLQTVATSTSLPTTTLQ